MNPVVITLKELKQIQEDALNKLVDEAGSVVHLARMLGKPAPTVQSWCSRGRISKEGAELVEKHPRLNKVFSKRDLRPDLFL